MRSLLLCPLAALAISGCASSSLKLAPARPDTPYKPADATGTQPGERTQATRTPSGARDFGLAPMAALPTPAAGPQIDRTHTYGLAELVDLAQSNNPDTRIAWERARQAALGVGMAKALYLPMLSAKAIAGGQRQTGTTKIGELPARDNDRNLKGVVPSVSLQWLVFDFGQRDAMTRAAEDLSLASNTEFNGAHQRIIYTVSRNFFEYGAARRRAAIATQSRAESVRILDAANERFKNGVGTSVEVAQARQSLAQAELSVVQSRGATRDSYHSLIASVGLSPDIELKIEDVSGRRLSPAAQGPVDKIVATAVARRADTQSAYLAARSARAGVDAAKADLMPKVFLSASDTYTRGTLNITSMPDVSTPPGVGSLGLNRIETRSNDLTILGGVAVPIYDGGVRDARIRKAQSSADAAAATVVRLERNAATEIVAADDALRNALATVEAANALENASATSADATLAAYKSGAGALTAAMEAQRGLLSARMAKAESHATALIAAATVAFATGRLASSDDVGRTGLQ